MKTSKNIFAGLLLATLSLSVNAGNGDRAGSAGTTDLLINPWARSAGWNGANSAFSRGLEAQFANVAGLSGTTGTELSFTHSQWLMGTGIGLNTFGFSQNMGKNRGVIGLSVMSLSSGDITETTVNNPEGTGNVYQVGNLHIALSYAKAFNKKISGGITVRVSTSGITNVNATGVTVDAGIQYKTKLGKRELNEDNLHFGITLKNIGPRMMATGDGLATQLESPFLGVPVTVQQRSSDFEVPAMMNIGIGYIYRITKQHAFDFAFNFTSHSFTYDQFILGVQYNFKNMLFVRGGYTFEEGIFGRTDGASPTLLNAFTGPSAGLTFEAGIGKEKKTKIAFDYGFRATNIFNGTHSFGARFLLN